MIAGPNGAGKTTFARSFLTAEANCPQFINADLIAAGLSPFAPEAAALWAGQLMLQKMAESKHEERVLHSKPLWRVVAIFQKFVAGAKPAIELNFTF